MRALAMLSVLVPAVAAADDAALFAQAHERPAGELREVRSYALAAGDYARAVTAKFPGPDGRIHTGVVLVREPDEVRRIDTGDAETIAVTGVVDLIGPPGALPEHWTPSAATALGWPALIVRTTRKRMAGLYVISLVDADRGAAVILDSAPRGRTYQLARTGQPGRAGDKPLEIIARDAGGCEQRFVADGRHYAARKGTCAR